MYRVRAVIAFILCVSLLLAASSASQSGKDEEAKVHGLSESEAVLFENELDDAIEHRREEIRIWAAAVEANRIEAEEAARRAQEEQERRAAARRAAAASRATQSSPAVAGGSVWDRLAQCESGGNWQINTGNGYYGGLQFNLQTWQAYGGTGYPHQHSRETQIAVAERLRAARGFQPWPACSRKLGLR